MTGVAIGDGRSQGFHSVRSMMAGYSSQRPAAMADAIMLQPSATPWLPLAPHGTARTGRTRACPPLCSRAGERRGSKRPARREVTNAKLACTLLPRMGRWMDGSIDDQSKLAASHPPIKLLSELTFAGYGSSGVTRRVLSLAT
jgi:hypothetical protein